MTIDETILIDETRVSFDFQFEGLKNMYKGINGWLNMSK